MVVKSLHQFFYYHNKYLNSMKYEEISMGPSIPTIQCTLLLDTPTLGSGASEMWMRWVTLNKHANMGHGRCRSKHGQVAVISGPLQNILHNILL